ncbi:FAD-dependent oxidoreductase [Mycolicibacterium sp. 120270]|uniref:FAD-dependent oxidoreductase n=1 Tax=Mycolicibacterium sp. 120270 TaxID=3090600 RepID=UPI00299F0234|nr:FAD-dependent oxidoreductase [Mycolicibacterium sp. 120270]MDX1885958.1 FAD-dependent oxidoreductase [Mycolicibacterium sp. 120270]
MSEQQQQTSPEPGVKRCDVCIVGAGIAGMNALFAASRYLSRDQKVILVDQRQRVGGMWVDTYPYVRLHQPHPMFTAGNIEWTLGAEPEYLATKHEVLDHFTHCLKVIKERVQVDELFGVTMESAVEGDQTVCVTCRSDNGEVHVIDAKRLIKAFGVGVTPNDPLEVSSRYVESVSPDFCDVRAGDIRNSEAPVWVIGGGKTGMDTAHTLITNYPGREINLVAGRGTFFTKRDRFFPPGAKKWWAGTQFATVGDKLLQRYNGTNEAEVHQWYRATYCTHPTAEADNYFAGLMSESETATISEGLNDVVMDYFADAVDRNGSTELVFRSGATRAIERGSWIVNCTGYLRADNAPPYEPYVSAGGAVVAIHPRSWVLHLPAFHGYFLTHLLFLDKLREVPLYEVDMWDLRRKSPTAHPYALFALVQHNLSLIYENVPRSVFSENGLDFDAWYPKPRRLPGLLKFMLTHRRSRKRARHVLDTVRDRFDIRCGTLSLGADVGSEPVKQ